MSFEAGLQVQKVLFYFCHGGHIVGSKVYVHEPTLYRFERIMIKAIPRGVSVRAQTILKAPSPRSDNKEASGVYPRPPKNKTKNLSEASSPLSLEVPKLLHSEGEDDVTDLDQESIIMTDAL